MEMELSQHFLITDELRQQMAPPATHILDRLTVFPGTSPYSSPAEFVERLESMILAYPEVAHLLGGIGEPLSGKLSVVAEIWDLLTHRGSRLRQFASQNGYSIRKYLLTWGEPFDVIEHKDLPADMPWQEKSRVQTPEAVPIFFDSLAKTIEGYDLPPRRRKVIRLIGYDAVAHTGIKFDDDREYGLVRANKEMQQLALHTGPFAGLEYCDWRFGIAAANELRIHNKQFRAAILGARSVEERASILEIFKKDVKLDKSLASYGSDEASIANTEEIEAEMEDLAFGLSQHGLIDLSEFGELNSPKDLAFPSGSLSISRDRIIGGIVNPKMFELAGVNPHLSTHFFNHRNTHGTVLNLKGYRSPVRELYYPS